MTQKFSANFSPAERRNWGYWDGFNDRQPGRLPEWSRTCSGCHHPFDDQYGRAYWRGWDGLDHPNGENEITRNTREWILKRAA